MIIDELEDNDLMACIAWNRDSKWPSFKEEPLNDDDIDLDSNFPFVDTVIKSVWFSVMQSKHQLARLLSQDWASEWKG